MRNLGQVVADVDEAREARRREERWTLIFLAASTAAAGLIAATAIAILFAAWPAHAHDAPTGWSYPFACCSGYDCREVGGRHSQSKVRVLETSQGYQITSTGEVITWADARLKDSPDGEYHWCSVAGADDSRTICLFVPPRSF